MKQFDEEYEQSILGMLRGEGELNCAIQLYRSLHQATYKKMCGITQLGLACDWRGLLYPCHRALELGPHLAVGDVYNGIDRKLNLETRAMIDEQSYHSEASTQFPLVTFCPVAIHQKHRKFSGEWNKEFGEMLTIRAKLVSKHYHEIGKHIRSSSAKKVDTGC
ncbi:MAG: hypothetical protein ACREBQ_00365 [Nitrososphaerales archaeon]